MTSSLLGHNHLIQTTIAQSSFDLNFEWTKLNSTFDLNVSSVFEMNSTYGDGETNCLVKGDAHAMLKAIIELLFFYKGEIEIL